MIDLGIVKPGSTVRVPFGSYAAATGAPSATTNFADADILIYKDGGTTQRASAAGITATTGFDSLTGINMITVDLADNTTSGFYVAGSEYFIVISDITVDGQTLRFPIARFRIGLPNAVLNTTIATLASQTSFTLTVGPADNGTFSGDGALKYSLAYIHDAASAVQFCLGEVSSYVGSTKTVTLRVDPGVFTMAVGDNISFLLPTGTVIGSINGSLQGDVAGNVNGSVNNVLALAANSVNASALATDAVTEIQNGLATQASLVTLAGVILTVTNKLNTMLESAPGSPGEYRFTADAMAQILVDLGMVSGNLDAQLATIRTALPSAVPGASGGLVINGANTGNVTFSDGITINTSTTNRTALELNGNGTGNGFKATGGATGAALRAIGGSTSGAGLHLTTTSGDGISVTPTAGHGLVLTGQGTSKHGVVATGSASGTGDGISAVAGAGGVDIRGNITGNLSGSVASVGEMVGMTEPAPGSPGERRFTTDALVNAPSGGLNAAGIRAALGMSSANLDSQLADIQSTADQIIIDLAAVPNAAENADGLLGRNIEGGSSSGRIVSEALYPLRNRWDNSSGTYQVFKNDDTTMAWSSAISSDVSAEPIVGSNPAG